MNARREGSVPWWAWLLLLVTYVVPLLGAFAWLGYSKLGWPGVLIVSLKVLMCALGVHAARWYVRWQRAPRWSASMLLSAVAGALVGALWWTLGWPPHVKHPIPAPLLEWIADGVVTALWLAFLIGLEDRRPAAAPVGRHEAT